MSYIVKEFKNCDEWWSELSPEAKMWIHEYFYEQPDESFFRTLAKAEENKNYFKERHSFMEKYRGIVCGGIK